MKTGLVDIIQLNAIYSTYKPDEDYFIRRVFRWYSEKFHTPLHTVWELPLYDVLVAYYESYYENLEDEDRKEALADLLESPEERMSKEVSEKESDDAFMEQLQKKVQKDEQVKEKPKTLVVSSNPRAVPPPPPDFDIKFDEVDDIDFGDMPSVGPKNLPKKR